MLKRTGGFKYTARTIVNHTIGFVDIVGSLYRAYSPTLKKLQENVFWYFLLVQTLEKHMPKVFHNWSRAKGYMTLFQNGRQTR